MGCFDSVVCNCPECNAQVYFQSKAGDCQLICYRVNSVPMSIADDLNDATETCPNCGAVIRLVLSPRVTTRVAMDVICSGQ